MRPDGTSQNRRRSVGIKLTVVTRRLGRRFDQAVETVGLSRAKFGVIAIVARQPGATQRSIAELLEVTEVTAGRLIERLCADGYLERRADPEDRRAHRIHLTAKTEPVLDQLASIANDHEEWAFGGLSDGDLDQLDALLDKIASNVASPRERALVEETSRSATRRGKTGQPA